MFLFQMIVVIWDGLGINVKLYMDNLCELENREVVC